VAASASGERSMRRGVRLLAPLGDEVTWIAPCWLSQAEDQVLQVGTLGWRRGSELSHERRAPSIPWQSPLSTNRRSHNEHPLGIIPVNEKCDLHFLDNHSRLATWPVQATSTSGANGPWGVRFLPASMTSLNLMVSSEEMCELLHTSIGRFRFLVASPPVRVLLLFAKHLFVAAKIV